MASSALAEDRGANESVLPLVMIRKDTNEFLQGGSGFVVGRTKRYLVTAKHVPGKYLGKPGYQLLTFIDKKPCALEELWTHHVADVTVFRFACEKERVMRLQTLSLGRSLPDPGTSLTLYGFDGKIGKDNAACEHYAALMLCPRHTAMQVTGTNVPMSAISSSEQEAEEFLLREKRRLRSDLVREDLFFDGYIVAQEVHTERYSRLSGYSGGPLVDKHGTVFGIYSGNSASRNAFTPTAVIPKSLIE